MLPDFPEIKEKIQKKYLSYIEKNSNSDLLNQIPKETLLEGDKLEVNRCGEKINIEFKKIESCINIDIKSIERLEGKHIFTEINKCADELKRQKSSDFYTNIFKAVDKVGNNIDAQGEPLQPKHIFQLLEKISINFKRDGTFSPYIVAHPGIQQKVVEVINTILTTPELKKQYDELIEKKRREWRDRESNRKLVG